MSRSEVDLKRARWDLNPGSPAPQASVLIQSRPRALFTGLRRKNNDKNPIINTPTGLRRNNKNKNRKAHAKLLLNDSVASVGDTLSRRLPSLLTEFILLFEPISPRFVSFLVGRKLKEWKNKGLIDGYKAKTKRIGKFHYKIYLDLDLT